MAVMKDIERAIAEKFGKGFIVTPVTNDKGNGVVKKGVAIRREGTSVGMCFYFENEADRVRSGERAIAEIAEHAWEVFAKQEPEIGGINLNGLTKEKILEDVQFALKCVPGNEGWLEEQVTRSFLNMAITYIYPVNEVGNIRITNALAKTLEITEEELCERAKANGISKQKWCVEDLGDLLCEMKDLGGFTDDDVETVAGGDPQILVLTNKYTVNGAAVLLQDLILKRVSKMFGGKDFLIIPSSIHEVLAVPAEGIDDIDIKGMNALVYETNKTAVEPDDWLGFNLLRYNSKTQELSIA